MEGGQKSQLLRQFKRMSAMVIEESGSDYFQFFGFTGNPFENNTAEREPNIASYAVRPPFLDRVLNTAVAKGIYVLSGTRGSGKSATRITVDRSLRNTSPSRLVVPLLSFNVFRPYKNGPIPLELYANQIAFLAVEQILSWLSSLDEAKANDHFENLSGPDKAFVRKFIANFYLSRPENARQASAAECFETLNISLPQKSLIWLDRKWDAVATAVANFATKLGEKKFDVDLGDAKNLAELLQKQKAEGFVEPIYVFTKIVEFARLFGFSGVAIHIDKVDETDWTATSAEAAADLIYGLLANIQLHEIDGLTWTFFLWDKVKDVFSPPSRSVRWDKIPDGEISWTEEYLHQLIKRRLEHFSNGSVASLAQICAPSVAESDTVKKLIALAEQSPRNLVSLLDTTLSLHMQVTQQDHRLLDEQAFEVGMDTYAKKVLVNGGHKAVMEQLAKNGLMRFNSKDVGSRFGKGSQAARARIDSWVSSGLVDRDGSEVGPDGGRPVDHFAVTDPKAKRWIERSL